jgi:hypothetical protein
MEDITHDTTFFREYANKLLKEAKQYPTPEINMLANELERRMERERLREARIDVLRSAGSFMTKRARLTASIAEQLMSPEEEADFMSRKRKFEQEDGQIEGYLRKYHTEFQKKKPSATPFEEFRHMTKLLVAEVSILTTHLQKAMVNNYPDVYSKKLIEDIQITLKGFAINEL